MPLSQVQIEEAAAFLFHLRVHREVRSALPHEIAPRSVDDAYAIQNAIHTAAGWPIGALKVGCTSAVAQEFLSIPHPIGGRIPADAVFGSDAEIPASFFGNPPAIECEFALQVDAAGQVTAVAPALELVDPRVPAGGTHGGFTTIADNSAGCAVILGTPTPISEIGDLAGHAMSLVGGGAELVAGTADAVIGGPAASVDWALAHEAESGRVVEDGTWIITGTCTGLTPTSFGQRYEASFGTLGTVSYSTSER